MKSYNSNKATASANQPRWFVIAVILIMAMQIIILCEGRLERSLKRDTYYYSKAAKTKAVKTVSYQTKSAKNVHQSMMNEYTTKAGKDEIGVDSKSSKAGVDFHHAHSMSMGGVSYEAKAAKTKAAKGDSHYFSFFHHGSTDGALDVELNATVVNATTSTTDEATTGTTTDAVLSDTTDAVVSDRAPLNAGSEEDGSSSGGQVLSRRNFMSFLTSSVSALFFLIYM
jgi:hypothetical protein